MPKALDETALIGCSLPNLSAGFFGHFAMISCKGFGLISSALVALCELIAMVCHPGRFHLERLVSLMSRVMKLCIVRRLRSFLVVKRSDRFMICGGLRVSD